MALRTDTASRQRSMVGVGALAGAVSVLVFTAVHHLLISNIWPMLPVMLAFGAATGAALAWSNGRLGLTSNRAQFAAAGMWLVMLALLGGTSLLVYQPITTFAEVNASSRPVDELIVQSLPLTALWATVIVLLGAIAQRCRGREVLAAALPLAAAALLVALTLGLNLSVFGLIEFDGPGWWTLAEFCGYVVLIVGVYAGAFLAIDRCRS